MVPRTAQGSILKPFLEKNKYLKLTNMSIIKLSSSSSPSAERRPRLDKSLPKVCQTDRSRAITIHRFTFELPTI